MLSRIRKFTLASLLVLGCFLCVLLFIVIFSWRVNFNLKNLILEKRRSEIKNIFASKSVIDALLIHEDQVDQIKWRVHPWHLKQALPLMSKHTNILTDGSRKTFTSAEFPIETGRDLSKKVYFYGGSTAFGYGVNDFNTIPSRLADLLGRKFKVKNFGDAGSVFIQELNLFLEHIDLKGPPEVAIFYNGWNDAFVSLYEPAIRRRAVGFDNVARYMNDFLFHPFSYNILRYYFQRTSVFQLLAYVKEYFSGDRFYIYQGKENIFSEDVLQKKVNLFFEGYRNTLKQTSAICRAYRVKCLFFWQPFVSDDRQAAEKFEEVVLSSRTRLIKTMSFLKKKMEKNAMINQPNEFSNNFFYLGNILDKKKPTMFFDYVHTTKEANSFVAEAIYKKLIKAID